MNKKPKWQETHEFLSTHGTKEDFGDNPLEAIRKMWNERAVSGKETLPDRVQHNLEINYLLKHIKDTDTVLDVGCGSGYATRRFAEKASKVIGIDFAPELINKAKKNLDESGQPFNINFAIGDITKMEFPDAHFDVVVSERVLINLHTTNRQEIALREVHRVLKDGGQYLMLETNKQGINGLNEIREKVGLEEIAPPWHNLPIDEEKLRPFIDELYKTESIVDFSPYFFISRIIHPLLSHPEKPKYGAKINTIAAKVMETGSVMIKDMSQIKLHVLRKI